MPDDAAMKIKGGICFLRDYLNEDTYFKISYPQHNLIRACTQLKLVKEMEDSWGKMRAIVMEYHNVEEEEFDEMAEN